VKKNNFIFSIGVDGSSASGKTTGSKIIAKRFGFKLLSSGKLYRYLALRIIKNNRKYNHNFIKKVAKNLNLKKLSTKKLYNTNVTKLSSIIAKKKYIRKSLKLFQLDFIKKNKKVIIEGRDIASKIMPNADLKIYFKCSTKEKAKRRFKEFEKINKKVKIKEVEKALKLRDFSDMNRKESPLLFVKGAVLVDTTNLSMKQMEARLTKLVAKAIENKKHGNL
jgi:cytidylate kinase|tara:strand:- start:1441 stop:2103 length:663 start_codon:yes stop_codon:yes gene_type:complete